MSDTYTEISEKIERDYLAQKEALELLAPILNKQPKKEIPIRKPLAQKLEAKSTIPCEAKGCVHRVHAGNPPCESCTKKVCAKCKRGSICKECSLMGDK